MLTYELIRAAHDGDPCALQQILKHYAGYINFAASERVFNGYSSEQNVVNSEVRDLIEAELMAAILQWKEKDEFCEIIFETVVCFGACADESRVWGRHSPTRFPWGQNEQNANFGTMVESCSAELDGLLCGVR